MAETAQGKKRVYVEAYETGSGVKVPAHYRSTPRTSTGPVPKRETAKKGRAAG